MAGFAWEIGFRIYEGFFGGISFGCRDPDLGRTYGGEGGLVMMQAASV